MAESDPTPKPTITSLCLDCQHHFRILHDTLQRKKKESELSSVAVENELGRFRIWASDIGAMHIGRRSLDYRLQYVNYLYVDVISLLEDIKDGLIEG
jgi:hypothetical protein